MNYVHVYAADGSWLGQFKSIDAVEAYMHDHELDINSFRIEFGPSKYPA